MIQVKRMLQVDCIIHPLFGTPEDSKPISNFSVAAVYTSTIPTYIFNRQQFSMSGLSGTKA